MFTESLAIVLDVNPLSFPELDPRGDANASQLSLKSWWVAACSFVLYYAQVFPTNNLVIIACHANTAKFLFRGKAADFDSREAIKTLFTSVMPTWACDGISMLAVALNKALASVALTNESNMRILVLLTSSGSEHLYIAEELLRIVFAAGKMGVVIDSMCYRGKTSPVWQQASTCTGGLALSFVEHADPQTWQLPAPQTKELLKQSHLIVPLFLVFMFLAPKSWRTNFLASAPFAVENAAHCSCHNKRLMLGKLCSKCFLVYCDTVKSCPNCEGET